MILYICFFIVKINNFRGDLSDISAGTATCQAGEVVVCFGPVWSGLVWSGLVWSGLILDYAINSIHCRMNTQRLKLHALEAHRVKFQGEHVPRRPCIDQIHMNQNVQDDHIHIEY